MSGLVGKDGAANSSPPPYGEGLGVGVVQCGTSAPLGTTPLLNPPPQGRRESSAARPEFYLQAGGAGEDRI
jgi:hypothetical protein